MFIGISFDITRKGSGGGGSTLLTGLVSYWKLDETSGTRSDSTGTNNLTDNNTVASIAGKVGNAATFVAANSESLTVADVDNSLDGGNRDFSYSLWVKTTASGSYVNILDKSNDADHALRLTSAGALQWEIGSFTRDVFSSAVNDGNWHHVICWYDATAALLKIVLDNGTIAQSLTVPSGWFTNNTPFALGATSAGADFFTGSIDEVGRWNRLLTATERTQLWNGGAGVTYPSFS